MKAVLRYDLEDSGDTYNLKRALASLEMYCVLISIQSEFRAIDKYDSGKVFTREMFNQILDTYAINLDDLGQ